MVYKGVYQQTTRFGYNGNGTPITGDRFGRQELTLWRQWDQSLTGIAQAPHLASSALGSWGVDSYHAYDSVSKTLFKGDGLVRTAQSVGQIISTVVNKTVTQGYSGDGGPANQAWLAGPRGITLGPDGSLYIADTLNQRIRRVDPGGIITTVAGTGDRGYSGDGGPADQAELSHPSVPRRKVKPFMLY